MITPIYLAKYKVCHITTRSVINLYDCFANVPTGSGNIDKENMRFDSLILSGGFNVSFFSVHRKCEAVFMRVLNKCNHKRSYLGIIACSYTSYQIFLL